MMTDQRLPTYLVSSTKPKLRLPSGAWDTHCHVFGPKDRYPFAATTSRDPADAPRERLFALHATLGTERYVIVQSAVHGTDNRVVEDALTEKRGAYLGVALLPLSVAGSELRRLDHVGLRGVRFNFIKHLHQTASIDQILDLAPRLADIGWHLQIHMEGSMIEAMGSALQRSPIPVVIDHIGRIDAGLGLRQARSSTCCVCWSMIDSGSRSAVATALRAPGRPMPTYCRSPVSLSTRFPDRVLWGSDWPHPNHPDPIPDDGMLVDIIAEMAPSEDLRRKLMVENPRRLYDRDGLS
jgi:2-pyrone-4,6-dicarboxylate lactonase